MSTTKRSRAATNKPAPKPAGAPIPPREVAPGQPVDALDAEERGDTEPDPRPVAPDDAARRSSIRARDARLLGGLGVVLAGAVLVYGVQSYRALARENADLRAELALSRGGGPLAEGAASGPAVAGPRGITAPQRAALVTRLQQETSADRRAWIAVLQNNPDAVVFGRWLEAVFREAGWPVESGAWPGSGLKAGIFFFSAEENNPSFVTAAQEGLEAAGLKPMVAGGYRDYYAEKKKANPSWVGLDLKKGQAFAIVIGPKEEPGAARP